MTDPTEIARVAAGLTRAQREFIASRPSPDEWPSWTSWLPSSEVRSYRGLVKRAGCCSNQFTSRGLAVRDHMLREKSGG